LIEMQVFVVPTAKNPQFLEKPERKKFPPELHRRQDENPGTAPMDVRARHSQSLRVFHDCNIVACVIKQKRIGIPNAGCVEYRCENNWQQLLHAL